MNDDEFRAAVVIANLIIGVVAYLGLIWELSDAAHNNEPPSDPNGRPKAKHRKGK